MKSLKTLSLILIAFLFLLTTACGNSGGSADSAKASTMRLVRTEGVVSLSDEEGESIPVEIDMRLFSGNAISTEVESRAGISLDDAKTATLDEKSLARLHQDGKMLSLNLEDGALYFNVSKPLDEDESFEISTSTMTLGIRGTAGYVAAVDENTCRIILATGHAVITAIDGKTQEISGAQQVLVTITPTGAEFTVLPIRPDAYPAILTEGLLADQIEPETPEATVLPTDGDRIVFTGTLELYSYAEMVELQGEPDPNAQWANPNESYYILVLDEPQTLTLKAGDGYGSRSGTVRMIEVRADSIVFGHHTFSIDPTTTHWPSDTSMPLGQPRTSDLHVLD